MSAIKTWTCKKFRQETQVSLLNNYSIQLQNSYRNETMELDKFCNAWFGFDEDKIKETQILIEILTAVPLQVMPSSVSKLAEFYAAYDNPFKWEHKELRPDQLFFYGTRNFKLSVQEKIEKRNGIFECVKSSFKLEDAFKIFDLTNVQFRREVKNNSGGEDYLYIEDNKIVYGGYDQTGGGGCNYHDPESVYYWPEEIFNLVTNGMFKGLQRELKSVFEGKEV